jgi:predicted nucleic acid-binding protein
MKRAVFLDSTPLGLLCQRRGIPAADACRTWLAGLSATGVQILVPEIIAYELRRELLRLGKTSALARFDAFIANPHVQYLRITTNAMWLAAELWAGVRRKGSPTADPHALDIDVILAAQALTAGMPSTGLVVATGNVAHLSRFVPAELWNAVVP